MRKGKEWIFHYHHGTPERFASTAYRHQKSASKKRGHPPPNYTKEEFTDWLINHNDFSFLYGRWLKTGRQKDYYPSVDRIDNRLPYTFSNISLKTYRENQLKYSKEVKQNKPQSLQSYKPVSAYNLDGSHHSDYPSLREAARQVKGHPSNIIVAIKEDRIVKGFKWQYT